MRLIIGTQRMQTDPPAGVSASPIADNVMTWYVSLMRRAGLGLLKKSASGTQ
jgi:hypothetical protein